MTVSRSGLCPSFSPCLHLSLLSSFSFLAFPSPFSLALPCLPLYPTLLSSLSFLLLLPLSHFLFPTPSLPHSHSLIFTSSFMYPYIQNSSTTLFLLILPLVSLLLFLLSSLSGNVAALYYFSFSFHHILPPTLRCVPSV